MILDDNIKIVYSNGKSIQKVYSYGELVWEYKTQDDDIDYSVLPFTVKAVADDVSVKLSGDTGLIFSYKYSINGGSWEKTYTSDTINIKKGDTIAFKGTKIYRCVIEGLSDIYGNIMSLQYDDNFIGQTVWLLDKILGYGYFESSDIRNAHNLILPATTLTERCYQSMFYNCSSLTTPPELPATMLANACYHHMFDGCTSLTTPPELPATTLTERCYQSMFYNCSSLTTAPELPATTLTDECYNNMFRDCTSLTTPPELPATMLANTCYHSMFYNCTSLTTAPELPATRLKNACYQSMFYNCSSLTTAPELPATMLALGCYTTMFYDCDSLNYIKCYAQYAIDDYIYQFAEGASPTGKLVCYEEAADAFREHIPSTWTVEYFT